MRIPRVSAFLPDVTQQTHSLRDESRSPLTHPNAYSGETKDAIRYLRKEALEKEKRYIGEKLIAHRLKKRFL